ncbi:tigger transposable element-derived protein 1-like [Eriocheir sinensis]|uniref:tigger transposable element-derived protein 1-like n=1 Tax=Eriocheir sinensis TaxID=95602 RepID=UPI0021CA7C34|nr:tigger transposable element-derived protein 1-like [Eriocheir sinensis]
MPHCVVAGCNTTNRYRHTIYSFFNFPKDTETSEKWLQLCGRPDITSPVYHRICSLHFEPSAYERNLKYELLGQPVPANQIRLKPEAVPTLHLPSTGTSGSPGNRGRHIVTDNNQVSSPAVPQLLPLPGPSLYQPPHDGKDMMEPLCEAVKVEVEEEPTVSQASSTSRQPSGVDKVSDHFEDALSQCDEIGIKMEEEEKHMEDFDPVTGHAVFVPELKSNPSSTSDHSEDALFQFDEIGIKKEEDEVCIKDEPIEDLDQVTGSTTFAPALMPKPRRTSLKLAGTVNGTFNSHMAPKRPSTSSHESAAKKSRKTLTIEKKLEVLDRYARGEKTSVIVHAMGLNESTLRTIRASADKIRASAVAGTSASSTRCSHARSTEMERMEKLLAQWIQHQNKTNVPISMAIIQAKAVSLYKDVQGEGEKDKGKTFQGSSGWFSNFKRRYGFHNLTGEAASANVAAAKTYPATLKAIIEEGGYTAKQIFNIDETCLYWKKLPSRTYISVEESRAPGFKASKDRLTLLLGANAEGDYKLKPALVYHSENPRALKGYVKSFLPCYWYSNLKGWMTCSIFKDYFGKLEKELELYCEREKLPFKILLILDNAPSHPPSVENLSSNIQIAFLPPNTTSLLQPCDPGIIKTFKSYYLHSTLTDMVERTNKDKLTVREYWKQFTIKDALHFIKESWEKVPRKCLNGVWKNLCPQLVHDFAGFDIQAKVSKTILECLAKAREAGFEEIEEKDIVELLESHSVDLTNEELLEREKLHTAELEAVRSRSTPETPEPERVLTKKDLQEALSSIREALDILEAKDPNINRSATVSRKVMAELNCYQIMLDQKKKLTTQTKLDQFFRKKTVEVQESEEEEGDMSEEGDTSEEGERGDDDQSEEEEGDK